MRRLRRRLRPPVPAPPLVPGKADFARAAGVKQPVGRVRFVQPETVGEHLFQGNLPVNHKPRHFSQPVEAESPGTQDGQLLVDNLRADFNGQWRYRIGRDGAQAASRPNRT